MATSPKSVNPLAVMALKVKENTFDLGSWLRHISIRDQIIRARLLVRDLCESNQLTRGDKTLVIGAGAAGLAAAYALLENGVEVLVVDTSNEPFSLWKGVTERFVGPYMYEWPSSFFADQRFPPDASSVLSAWSQGAALGTSGLEFSQATPISADDLRKKWLVEVQGWFKKWPNQFEILVGIGTKGIKHDISKWHSDVRKTKGSPSYAINFSGKLWPSNLSSVVTRSFTPRLLFLAAGFGRESIEIRDKTKMHTLATGTPFWKNDQLRNDRAGIHGHAPVGIAVIGGGDGALQDTLRTLTGFETPLNLMKWIQQHHSDGFSHIQARLCNLAAIERQHELGVTWESARPGAAGMNSYQAVFDACRKEAAIAAKIGYVKAAMLGSLRTDLDKVLLLIRGTCFSKTYMLNRFLVLLFEECCKPPLTHTAGGAGKPVDFHVHWNTELIGKSLTHSAPPTYDITLSNAQTIQGINFFVVRLGIDETTIPGQYLGLTKRDTKNRRELAEVRLPFWVTS